MRKGLKEYVINLLDHIIKEQKKFNYKYYLTKNCSLGDNWKDKKKKMLEDAALGGESRGKVYKELFDMDSTYRQVADFLTEFLAHVLPHDFVEGKNKKIFNKKVLAFVKFNRFESFTRITMLHKFRFNEFKWLDFHAKKENAKYFINENQFVLWKILKWIFEDLLVNLCRCYFYCTEK
jgi:hypothetical protein